MPVSLSEAGRTCNFPACTWGGGGGTHTVLPGQGTWNRVPKASSPRPSSRDSDPVSGSDGGGGGESFSDTQSPQVVVVEERAWGSDGAANSPLFTTCLTVTKTAQLPHVWPEATTVTEC